MIVEAILGAAYGSLALLAHAGHMLTDSVSIGVAALAVHLAGAKASVRRTWGLQRLEVLAALANVAALWLVAGLVFVEAFHRLEGEAHGHVHGEVVTGVGFAGIAVNIAAALILKRASGSNLNVEGALRHVIADLLGSFGVVVSGVLVWAFDWDQADGYVSMGIAVLILLSTWKLLTRVVGVLLEATPKHIDVYRLCSRMEAEKGVTLIHDVHVWTITQGYDSFTAHVLIDPVFPESRREALLRRLRRIASSEFGIGHITLQLETSAKDCSEHHHVDHLHAHATES